MKIAKFTVRGDHNARKLLRKLRGISPQGWETPGARYEAPYDHPAAGMDYIIWQCKTDFEFTVPVPDDRVDQFKKIIGNIPFTFQGE